MKKSLFYLLSFALIQFFVTWIVYTLWILCSGHTASDALQAFGGSDTSAITPTAMVLAAAVSGAALIGLFAWRRWAPMSPAWLRGGRWDVLTWAAVAAVGTLIPSMWLQEMLPPLPEQVTEAYNGAINNRYGYFTLCLLTPFAEEVVFRGAILRALQAQPMHRWAAIGISAAMFAVCHVNPAQMPHALLMGILLGWMYMRTGSILPGIAVHWVNNTVVYTVQRLFPMMRGATLEQTFGGNTNSVVLAIIFSMLILVPAIYQLNLRMRR